MIYFIDINVKKIYCYTSHIMKAKHKQTPLYTTLVNHAVKNMTSFHTPGHKNGAGIEKEFLYFIGKNFFMMDVTVFPEVDSLHQPSGPIKFAQELMADLYGVKESLFLVNGSTSGNLSMLLSACNPKDSIIVSRNTHKSILSAIVMSGVWPIWIQPKIDRNLDIILSSTPRQIEEKLEKFPEAKAVFLTYPTYNGICANIKEIVRIVHKHGKLLLVDEAWGAHLKFHPDLPISAEEAGADMIVQSTHKTLGAISQGSVLHVNSDEVDIVKIKKVVSMLQTTSPCYPILASIDLTRKQMAQRGRELTGNMLRNANYARKMINKLKKIYCFGKKDVHKGYNLDSTKLTMNVTKAGISGYEIDQILNEEYNLQVDCSDLFNIIAILGIGTSRIDMKLLVDSLSKIDVKYKDSQFNRILDIPNLSTEMVLMPRDVMLNLPSETIPLKDSEGRISAEVISPYPPGIPILIPGERIIGEIIDYLNKLNNSDNILPDYHKKKFEKIRVVTI